MSAKPGSTITKTIALGNTGVSATVFYVTGINLVYTQGSFVSGAISIAGYLDAIHPDALENDTIKAASGPATNQDVMAWAVATVLADAKYVGGVLS